MSKTKILITGALGQVGTELSARLEEMYGNESVIVSDIADPSSYTGNYHYEKLDVLDKERMLKIVKDHGITQIYHLAALLSATAEKKPDFAWKLNMDSLLHVLNIARDEKLDKVYWPSSIAVFGPTTPKRNTPQNTIMDPNTVYGISKLAGERWCEYYNQKFGVDVRSLGYPGLISYKAEPGGGTTDYAIHIFYEAIRHNSYTCFLSAETALPMLYMPDAIDATVNLMHAPAEKVKIRSSYNISGVSFTPAELAYAIRSEMPDFKIDYQPDFRQKIADSWPGSIDDTPAREDWGWKPHYGTTEMVQDMLINIRKKL